MSGIDETRKLLGWDRRLYTMEEEEEHIDLGKFMLVFFLLGTLFGMALTELIIPYLLDIEMVFL